MNHNINLVDFHGEFKDCPLCGYRDGFHTMLLQENDIKKWLFICPSCHEIFDIGQTLS